MYNEIISGLIGAVITVLVSLVVFWKTYRQAGEHHVGSYKLSQYIAITQRVFDVDMMFIRNSELRPYFYESKIVTRDCNIQQITAVAEYILDFYSTLQEHELLLASQQIPSWAEWTSYISDGFHGAPFLCDYYERNKSWYEEGLMRIYEPVREEQKKLISQQRAEISVSSE
jgi:hypothetical protein